MKFEEAMGLSAKSSKTISPFTVLILTFLPSISAFVRVENGKFTADFVVSLSIVKLGLGDSTRIGDGTNMSLLSFCFDENRNTSTMTASNPTVAIAKFFIK